MFDGRFRHNIDKNLEPVGAKIRRFGVRADHVTLVGVAMSVGAAVAIGNGAMRVGLLMLALTGIPDLVDGAVAKAWGQTSKRGAFFDSVSDRFTDAMLFGGVTWYFSVHHPGPLAVLPMAVFASAALVSYIRAKADALGFDATGGLIERAERFILLGLGLLFDHLLVPVLVLMLALNLITATQRFVKVWRQASEPLPPARPEPRRQRQRRVPRTTTSQRWRERTGRPVRDGRRPLR